jgi:SNF2 family DNA or RNA helicase
MVPSVPRRPPIETGEAYHGFIPERLARMVEAQPLNIDALQVTLRGYQAFGARYALLQRRILLGDEMGLGKTIIALAVMAHLLAEEDASHFLVVAPNSVLFNWRHEVEQRLALPARILHGTSLSGEGRAWRSKGGVGITTYGTLQKVALPPDALPLFVVDEAHYVKNPQAGRSINVSNLLSQVDRVMFMTGTPLEN